jgi:osmotically-inducible protein OsmY
MNSNDYLIGHLREAFATSPEVGTLDILIDVTGDTVYLSGVIDCESKRSAAAGVASRVAPDHRVVNDIKVFQLSPVEPAEVLNDTSGGHR